MGIPTFKLFVFFAVVDLGNGEWDVDYQVFDNPYDAHEAQNDYLLDGGNPLDEAQTAVLETELAVPLDKIVTRWRSS